MYNCGDREDHMMKGVVLSIQPSNLIFPKLAAYQFFLFVGSTNLCLHSLLWYPTSDKCTFVGTSDPFCRQLLNAIALPLVLLFLEGTCNMQSILVLFNGMGFEHHNKLTTYLCRFLHPYHGLIKLA